jgi:esterase/lipase superfamily enzyme
MRWLITNRNLEGDEGFGGDLSKLTYWTFDNAAEPARDIRLRSSWTKRTPAQFRASLAKVAAAFPHPVGTDIKDQKHVTLFIHGYNNDWKEAAGRYDTIAAQLFDGADSLGELVCFDWPSKGSLLGYLPDRAEARKTSDDLTEVLEILYNWMSDQQIAAATDPDQACRARTSIIAHSMGNYALEYALNQLWTRKNRPLLVSLMQEVIMVAADVDNDLFRSGETVSHGDGEGLANLSYRITALYTGHDDVLGSSAGLKHFGKRRLGRSGLDRSYAPPDNVWDVDCSEWLGFANGIAVHGAYFDPKAKEVYQLMRGILQGTDRRVLMSQEGFPAELRRLQS